MEIQNSQKTREKVQEKPKQEGQSLLPTTLSTASPPSSSSSPAHEFSFTVSLHHHHHRQPPSTATMHDKAKSPPPSFAVDLSPADDIFFHGHLLPLHLLSHLPVSPRSSTNSLDNFTLPIRELLLEEQQKKPTENNTNNSKTTKFHENTNPSELKGRVKSKSFSLFGLPKWRKGCENRQKEDREKEKKKLKFDVSDALKRYMRMVRPLLSFRGSRKSLKRQFQRQPYSFSGSLSSLGKQVHQFRGRKGEFSAPASMMTSPTNSGLLVANGALTSSNSDSSTMEELQAAIQSAITHCKNSIAVEEKI